MMSNTSLPAEIRQLPVRDRLALAEQIWDSIIEDDASFELSAARESELTKRLAARSSRDNQTRPWEDVRRDLIGEL